MYLTRNQAYRKVSGVRIPPSPPSTNDKALIFQGFFVSGFSFRDLMNSFFEMTRAFGGRYWDRTSDPCRVKAVLYR
jgi:hypothetical protein